MTDILDQNTDLDDPRTIDEWVAYNRRWMARHVIRGSHRGLWEFSHYFTVGHRRAHLFQAELDALGYETALRRRLTRSHVSATRRSVLGRAELAGDRVLFETLFSLSRGARAQYHGWDGVMITSY